MMRIRHFAAVTGLAGAAFAQPAAAETVTYTYDAKGRLVRVSQSSVNAPAYTATYRYDQADNRTWHGHEQRATAAMSASSAAATPQASLPAPQK